jgi:hypothetical protein
MARLGRHTATVLRPVGQDEHGDPLIGDPTETVVAGTSMQPADRGGGELQDHRTTVIEELSWWVPPGTDVRPTDQVRYRGHVYDVHGRPQPWDDEAGRPHHIEVQLRRVTG